MTSSLRTLPVVVVLALGACGGAAAPIRVSSPFTTADAQVFDQGVDFVDDPDILDGHWADEWTSDLHHRMGSADLVETVHIVSLRVSTQPDQDPTYMIDIAPDTALYGDTVDVDLRATTGDTGYSGIDTNQRRLLSGTFVLFVKWAHASDGTVTAKWHMSPASEKIVAMVRDLAQSRRAAADGVGQTQTSGSN